MLLTTHEFATMTNLLSKYKTPHVAYFFAFIFTAGLGLIPWLTEAFINCDSRNVIREKFSQPKERNWAAVIILMLFAFICIAIITINLIIFGA